MSDTILVIEDERVTRSSLKNFLTSEGFSVLTAENGQVGIDLARDHLPDLVICDIMMPELDGYDVLRMLQATPSTSKIPFIFLTVAADNLGQQQSLDMGADDYLSKPITSDRLRTAIENQLAKSKMYTAQALSTQDPLQKSVINPQSLSLDSNVIALQERLLEGMCRTYLDSLLDMNQQLEPLLNEYPELKQHTSLNSIRNQITNLIRLTNQTTALNKSLPKGNLVQLLEEFIKSVPIPNS